MQQTLGWILITFPGILFFGQIISTINFALAQKLRLQENPEETDSLPQRAEKYTAYWDVFTLGWMPLSGILMVQDNSFWPFFSFFAAAIYFDTSGREAAKYLSFKHEGLRIGTQKQQRFFFATYIVMAIISMVVLASSITVILRGYNL